MKKIQVLFPEPVMQRLRRQAQAEDRPLSELIRRATERWLDRLPDPGDSPSPAHPPPTFRLGVREDDPQRLRELIYDPDEVGP